ncbi:MAG: lipopolysaccharide heptosyltransferase II [Acidobacteriota bacterium]|nr:lipopolysaccharide heptosyltransferase II [Acidobacteriota bacterium]
MAADRLVVVSPNWLGDAVMALPAIADVRRHYPSAHLTVAARGPVAPLFSMVQGIDEVITLPGRGGMRALTGWQQDAAALASGRFDAALLLPNSFATGLIASRSGIAERWGFATDWRARYLTRAVPKPAAPLHQGAYYQALTTALGVPPGPLHARVWPNTDWARDVLREIGLDLDEPFAVFAPGAAYGRAKQWLPERFAQLAHLLIEKRNWSVVMVGANADREVCREIEARLPKTGTKINRLVDFSGKSDLATLAGILAVARAVVSNDSGAMHLACAVGTHVVALFGATNETRTSPLPAGAETPAPTILTHAVFCRPCMLRECPIDHRCMRGISAERAFESLP